MYQSHISLLFSFLLFSLLCYLGNMSSVLLNNNKKVFFKDNLTSLNIAVALVSVQCVKFLF